LTEVPPLGGCVIRWGSAVNRCGFLKEGGGIKMGGTISIGSIVDRGDAADRGGAVRWAVPSTR
jgi:hypothetical protein